MGSDGHDGKVIVLTGAGAGIGLAITRGLLVQPMLSLVIAVDVNTKELEALLPAHQDRLAVIEGDVSDRSTNQRAIETAVSRRGKLDSVILNAGMLRPVGPAADTNVEEWECLFGVNFFGPVHANY
ncbi:hypothetical protein LTR10_014525 [Elasticomyces elasticus]|uniref:Uncharacterized protein n=1 Tax=Exophiala sideris TaxID=1016849 RepID=A0ABR0JT88_9EURO|nr:hypothetical protein LTR10_014525 [Elasticomyces elasticus]KAK5040504.1 hypothetical protein LTS07_001002 [Exophiala sideris]KAK5068882.1 hypothetical protein LTR69_001003 [Exophiala sideris]KAK5186478.1 hypothetical protein LTR44_001534 [Eurotiomycetes sp. CCFEE 6388]